MKKLIYNAVLVLAVITLIPTVAATGTSCRGDAAYSTPPVVNNPTHIRNVVWKNMRAMCLQERSQTIPVKTGLSKPQETTPNIGPVQPQKPQ